VKIAALQSKKKRNEIGSAHPVSFIRLRIKEKYEEVALRKIQYFFAI
jgi:hypothetical protein